MIDPSTIDMKMALEMTYGRYSEPLSIKCDKFPEVIDFAHILNHDFRGSQHLRIVMACQRSSLPFYLTFFIKNI